MKSNSHSNYIYLGNDVVATNLSRSIDKHLDTRFLNKVFTNTEQNIINAATNPNIILWAMWAGKEAAFKALKKIYPNLIFSPKKFQIDIYPDVDVRDEITCIGTITHGKHILAGKWEFNPNKHFVHCVAGFASTKQNLTVAYTMSLTNYHVFAINPNNHVEESAQTRSGAIKYLISRGLNTKIKIVRESSSPPQLFINNQLLKNIDLSLSHDQVYAAVAVVDNHCLLQGKFY
jgi:phosphopantetheinyl transferase (holo-ACP synthase)